MLIVPSLGHCVHYRSIIMCRYFSPVWLTESHILLEALLYWHSNPGHIRESQLNLASPYTLLDLRRFLVHREDFHLPPHLKYSQFHGLVCCFFMKNGDQLVNRWLYHLIPDLMPRPEGLWEQILVFGASAVFKGQLECLDTHRWVPRKRLGGSWSTLNVVYYRHG